MLSEISGEGSICELQNQEGKKTEVQQPPCCIELQSVQVSDTTGGDSSNSAKHKKIMCLRKNRLASSTNHFSVALIKPFTNLFPAAERAK